MKAETIIRPRSERRKAAKEYCKQNSLNLSAFDREALVRLFLIEDTILLYEERLAETQGKQCETKTGEIARERNECAFKATLSVLKNVAETVRFFIERGEYRAVRRVVSERKTLLCARYMRLDVITEWRDKVRESKERMTEADIAERMRKVIESEEGGPNEDG